MTTAALMATLVISSPKAPIQATAKPTVTLTRKKTLYGVRAIALAGKPNSSLFAACMEDGKVRVIDAAGNVAGPTFTGHAQPAYAVAWSPDGKYIASGDEQAKIFLWDAKTGKVIREFSRVKGHTRGIQSISFAPDGKTFISVGKDDALCIWDIHGANPIWKKVGEPANFYGAKIATTGMIGTATLADGLRIYAPKTYALVAKVPLPGGQGANGFTMNDAGTLGVTCGRDTNVTLWDLKKRTRIAVLKGHTDWVINAELSPNSRILATSGSDAKVIIWDTKNYQQQQVLMDKSYVGSPIAFTGDGKYFVDCNSGEEVEIFTVAPSQGVATPTKRKRR